MPPAALAAVLALVFGAAACNRDRRPAAKRSATGGGAPAGARPAPRERAPRPPALDLPEAPAAAPAGGTPAAGGALRVHLETEPPHLHPLEDAHPSIGRVVFGLVYEPLVECRAGRLLPALADTWEVAPDATRVQLRLASSARWHDDRPFTVLDVQATLELVLRSTSRVPLLRAALADVAAVEIAAERTIRLRLHRPSHEILGALCEIPILPEPFVRGGPSQAAALGQRPVGTGPFRVAAWDRGRRIRLARHRAPGSPRRAPRLDEIVFEIDPDLTRALVRARRGDLDVLPRLLEAHHPEQVMPAALGEAARLVRLLPERFSFLAVNHRREPLGDVRVRRALSLLWDRARLADEIHRGLAHPLAAPPWGRAPEPTFDPAQAGRLLDAAGIVDHNGDGVRERGGVPLRLAFVHAAGSRTAAAEAKAFAMDLRRAGVLLEPTPVEAGALLARLESGAFDLAPLLWDGRADESPRLLLGTHGPLEPTGFRSERVQLLLDEVRAAPGPEARARARQGLVDVLAGEVPVIVLYRHEVPALLSRRVHGVTARGAELDLRWAWIEP